jgi:hypothetical protein
MNNERQKKKAIPRPGPPPKPLGGEDNAYGEAMTVADTFRLKPGTGDDPPLAFGGPRALSGDIIGDVNLCIPVKTDTHACI